MKTKRIKRKRKIKKKIVNDEMAIWLSNNWDLK